MKTTVKKWGINGEGIAFHEGSQYLLKMPFRMKSLNLILKVMKVLI